MNRIAKIQSFLKQEQLDVLIVDDPIDLYYLTHQELSLGRLVIDQKEATLFVDGRYFEVCKNSTSIPVLLTTGYGEKSAFRKWWPFSGKRIGFDAEYTTYSKYVELLQLTDSLVPLKNPIQREREKKQSDEIEKLRVAAELGSKGFDYICSLLQEGVTEKEIACELEVYWRKSGGDALAFHPHIAFGEGSSYPHYHSGIRALNNHELVLIDIGVVVDHYHSDMTRVVAIGKPKPEMEKVYQIVFTAYQAALDLCKPGIQIGQLDEAARGVIEQAGYGEYFPHSLGHGLGLEIHESPTIRRKGSDAERVLEENMVITIEPGIYLPGVFGVRLEDTIVITHDGYENLTNRPLTATLPTIQ